MLIIENVFIYKTSGTSSETETLNKVYVGNQDQNDASSGSTGPHAAVVGW